MAQKQALAFLNQARDFFSAAQNSDISAAKPLLLYYSFLNLSKCYIVQRTGNALGAVHHGLSEKLPTSSGAIHGHVSVDIAKNPNMSAFVKFANALGATLPTVTPPSTHVQIRSQDFLSQILVGHRMLTQSDRSKEKFISIGSLNYMCDESNKSIWIRARAHADDFQRLSYPITGLSKYLTNNFAWRNVKCSLMDGSRRLIEAETVSTTSYGQRPSQVLSAVSSQVAPRLWRSVTAYPPYRKYYVYQEAPTQTVLHQLLSIYISTFYFGSITRYKPEQFELILKSEIGPFVFEFFANQPAQFLYLMTSNFVEQEVARAAIA